MDTINNEQRNAEIARLHSEGMTLQEIGTRYGLTRECVRQIAKAQGIKPAREAVRKPKSARLNKTPLDKKLDPEKEKIWREEIEIGRSLQYEFHTSLEQLSHHIRLTRKYNDTHPEKRQLPYMEFTVHWLKERWGLTPDDIQD